MLVVLDVVAVVRVAVVRVAAIRLIAVRMVVVREGVLVGLIIVTVLAEVAVMVMPKPIVEAGVDTRNELEADQPEDGGEQGSEAAVGPLA